MSTAAATAPDTGAPDARIDRLLCRETTVWLSTVKPDGLPHLVPIWFSWDGTRLFVASKPDAVKVRNLRANPRVMLAVGEADDDFDVGLIEAVAELPDASTADLIPAGHFPKYADRMAAIGLAEAEYLRAYSQPILIRPTRFLPWHGRTTPGQRLATTRGSRVSRALDRIAGPLGLGRSRPAFGVLAPG